MRRSIATVSVSGTLEEKLDAIARARFDAVEIFENDLIHCRLSPEDIRRRCADLGLGIDLYQPFRDFEGMDAERFARNLDRAERKFDVMERLGTSMMLVCSNVSPHAQPGDELAAEQLHTLAERAARRGIRIAYEALAWGRHVNDYRHSHAIVALADHPHLGVCLDSFHILSKGDDPSGIEDIPADKIFFLQLADAPRMAMDVLQWSRHYRCFPGQGAFDLAGFLGHVLKAGYGGPLSLEVFNDVFRAAPNRRTTLDAYQSLLFLEEQVRNHLDAEGGSAPVTDRVELFDPPAPPELRGVSFLEFAVDDAAEQDLAKVLGALGFTRTGRHRSKNVALFQQGDIRVVLNNEPGSFASDHFRQHGPSLCALGLRTDDGVRATNRAVAFHVPRYEGRIGPHETVIPAVRAVDGSVLYFVSQALEDAGFLRNDFVVAESEAGAGPRGLGLSTVDHIAAGFPFEQFDTEVLFHRLVLGLQPQESLELADPLGLVRSCAMVDKNQTLRMALNMSTSAGTVTARSLSAQQGGGMQHIAFACEDIFAVAARLPRDVIRSLPVPDNYYDDLPARFDLDPALLARLQRHGVLYDRDEQGEFFHFYTEMFLGRFFFEVVQRTGNYRGFGASNAPVRMAAQARGS